MTPVHPFKTRRSNDILFQTNAIAKVYYSSMLSLVISRMENGLAEFKEKAPHRTDYIEATAKSITDLGELLLWIEIVFSDAEIERKRSFDSEMMNLMLLKDRNEFKSEAEKLIRTLEFNNAK